MEKKEIIIEACQISKQFKIREKTINVLVDIDLKVFSNEIVAITGASGSGKSTLINLLAGLDQASSGEIFFMNQKINNYSESKLAVLRNRYIGVIFQQHNLIKELTVLENVLLPSMIYFNSPKENKEIYQRGINLLERIGLSDRLHHHAGELSGGEAQRTAIVRAFINLPKLIFADEPTGNLDEKNSWDVFSLLNIFAKEHNISVVLVTHSSYLAGKSDRVFKINEGKLILIKK